ncbi:GNAT family N-acetyltransferase [Streptomyces sp. Rer75]|nr:GNAT family N-acetyltransferase [Streptomyces sp. Rer75]
MDNLADILVTEEGPGILGWLIDGARPTSSATAIRVPPPGWRARPSPGPQTARAQWSWGILTDELIGLIVLRRRSASRDTVSYIRREDTWSNGYATEAAKHVVTFAFSTVGLDRIEAMHHPANPAAGRVLTKAGFTRTGTSDRRIEDETAVPYQVYALLNL